MLNAVDLTPLNFFSRATIHPLWTVGILAAGAWYVLAVRRLRAAGGFWPEWRTVLYLTSLVIVAAATLSGLTWWNHTNFTIPVIRRVMLGMVAPIPFVLSAPLHLALEFGSARTKRLVQATVDSHAARFLTYPVVAWVIYGAWLSAVYFTHLYRLGVRHDSVNDVIDLAFFVVGVIFYTPAMGEDLPPRRMPPSGRLLYFLFSLPFHTIIGMALESQTGVVSPGLSLRDVHTGGGVMWSAGEIIAILSSIGMLVAWLRVEEHSAIERDATDEAEAAAQAAAWRAERRLAAAHSAALRGALRDRGAGGSGDHDQPG